MSLPETVKTASPGANLDVMLAVFGEAPDTGVRQAVLFAVGGEALSVEPG